MLEWLLTRHAKRKVVTETDEIVELDGLRNLDMLEDRALIEELINYNRDGNFDTVMAMMGAVIQLNEHWNEDFLDERRNMNQGASEFWQELVVNRYGTEQDKRKFRDKNRRRDEGKDNVSWLHDI